MKRKIFIEGKDPRTSAYIGWQNGDLSLYGVREGYKRAADELVDAAIREGMKNRIDALDMYIFPIMHCYRHSIEVSLKHIYFRTYGKPANGIHDMLVLWDKYIVGKVIKDLKEVAKDLKKDLKLEGVKEFFDEIRELIKELQGKSKGDSKGDVWRYLMDLNGNLYFTEWQYIDYKNLKDTIGYLYDCLDAIYREVDRILSE